MHAPTRLVAVTTEAQAAPTAGASTLWIDNVLGLCHAREATSRPPPTLGNLNGLPQIYKGASRGVTAGSRRENGQQILPQYAFD